MVSRMSPNENPSSPQRRDRKDCFGAAFGNVGLLEEAEIVCPIEAVIGAKKETLRLYSNAQKRGQHFFKFGPLVRVKRRKILQPS